VSIAWKYVVASGKFNPDDSFQVENIIGETKKQAYAIWEHEPSHVELARAMFDPADYPDSYVVHIWVPEWAPWHPEEGEAYRQSLGDHSILHTPPNKRERERESVYIDQVRDALPEVVDVGIYTSYGDVAAPTTRKAIFPEGTTVERVDGDTYWYHPDGNVFHVYREKTFHHDWYNQRVLAQLPSICEWGVSHPFMQGNLFEETIVPYRRDWQEFIAFLRELSPERSVTHRIKKEIIPGALVRWHMHKNAYVWYDYAFNEMRLLTEPIAFYQAICLLYEKAGHPRNDEFVRLLEQVVP